VSSRCPISPAAGAAPTRRGQRQPALLRPAGAHRSTGWWAPTPSQSWPSGALRVGDQPGGHQHLTSRPASAASTPIPVWRPCAGRAPRARRNAAPRADPRTRGDQQLGPAQQLQTAPAAVPSPGWLAGGDRQLGLRRPAWTVAPARERQPTSWAAPPSSGPPEQQTPGQQPLHHAGARSLLRDGARGQASSTRRSAPGGRRAAGEVIRSISALDGAAQPAGVAGHTSSAAGNSPHLGLPTPTPLAHTSSAAFIAWR